MTCRRGWRATLTRVGTAGQSVGIHAADNLLDGQRDTVRAKEQRHDRILSVRQA